MKLFRWIAASLLCATPAFADGTANQVIPGYMTMTPQVNCPAGPCFVASGSTGGAAATQTATSSVVTVQVVGEVRRPGVYQLPSDDRAMDAVIAAGGLLSDAEQAGVTLAAKCADGEQIVVPRTGAAQHGLETNLFLAPGEGDVVEEAQ